MRLGSWLALGLATESILLTRMLTTALDEHGCRWNRSWPMRHLSRLDRRTWMLLDTFDLATDQKVADAKRVSTVPILPGRQSASRRG